jgi:integrase
MSIYRRGNTWWYKFYFADKLIRESAKTKSKTLAKKAEKRRRRELEEGYNNLLDNRKNQIQLLKDAAQAYGESYKILRPKSYKSYAKYCIQHLVKHLGNRMLIEINPEIVEKYQLIRLNEGASGKTINEEIGILFRIMGDAGAMVRIRLKQDKKLKLPQNKDVGQALTIEEETRLLRVARNMKSPFIYPAIVLALNTGMRDSEMRQLKWNQIDLFKRILTVGKSKTDAGTGRTIPINRELLQVLLDYKVWYETKVSQAKPSHFVFPWSRSRHYDPTRHLVTFKTAWLNTREKADINIRFHDLRHTLITKLAESGAGDETIMAIAGHVSREMLSRYSHIRTEAKRRALESVATQTFSSEMPSSDTESTLIN